jgi:subtilisin family serine protease
MHVLIELRTQRYSPRPEEMTMGLSEAALSLDERIRGLALDHTYRPVPMPESSSVTGANRFSALQPMTFALQEPAPTHLVRGSVPDGAGGQDVLSQIRREPDVVGIFSDPPVQSWATCAGDPAVGNADDVAVLLDVGELHAHQLDGSGVKVAVVDSGINAAYLRARGRLPTIDLNRSFVPETVTGLPGEHPISHGTMCAFVLGICAPSADLLDHAVMLSGRAGRTQSEGLLSDAVLSYTKLIDVIQSMSGDDRKLVVTNSWGLPDASWDFPVGQAGNYTDDPTHPFNIIVGALEAEGADILFAAGNCGRDCPNGGCKFPDGHPIVGANSHPAVLCVAGVDTSGQRVGYSSQGPGRLDQRKPDVAAYTHFSGSGALKNQAGVVQPDCGTSAACPVMAGVVAAIRTKYSASELSPAQLRAAVYKTSKDVGSVGYDYDVGWGIIQPGALIRYLDGSG